MEERDDKYLDWKRRVVALDLIELKLERKSKAGLISERENKKIKKTINKAWIKIWDFYPNNSQSDKEFFELHFS